MDEGNYATVSREMAASGDFVLPTYNGEPFYDKPPFLYWAQALSIQVFSNTAFAARFPSAVAGTVLVLVVFSFARKIYGEKAGLLSAVVLASSLLTAGVARMAITDVHLALAMSSALFLFFLAEHEQAGKWAYIAFWLLLGIAVLIKGPVGLLLPLFIAGVYALWRGRIAANINRYHLAGLVAMLAITVPWFLAVDKASGGTFIKEFFLYHNVDRAMGKAFHHNYAVWFYIPIFLLGFFPWSVFFIGALKRLFLKRPVDLAGHATFFLTLTCGVIFLAFSALASKLPAYIYPMFPAAAVLVGAYLAKIGEVTKRELMWIGSSILAFSCLVAVALFIGMGHLPYELPEIVPVIIVMGAGLVAGSLAGLVFIILDKRPIAVASHAAGVLVFILAAVIFGLPIAGKYEAEPSIIIAEKINEYAETDDTAILYVMRPTMFAVPYYAERPVYVRENPKDIEEKIEKNEIVYLVVQNDRSEGVPPGGKPVEKFSRFTLVKYSDK